MLRIVEDFEFEAMQRMWYASRKVAEIDFRQAISRNGRTTATIDFLRFFCC